MTNALEGSRLKVERAKEHFRYLQAQIVTFLAQNPYGIVIDQDKKTGEAIWYARVSQEPPGQWAAIVGDIVHNLRAALDHIVFQLIGDPQNEYSEFPSSWKAEHYESSGRGKIKGVPVAAETIIQTVQPYQRGDAYHAHPLYLLNELARRDRHRLLNIVGAAARIQQFTIGKGDIHIDRLEIGGPQFVCPLKDGAQIIRLKMTAEPPVDVESQFAFEIAFEEIGPAKGQTVVPLLQQLISFVDGIVTIFQRFFP